MSQSDALFAELMRKLREVWAAEDEEQQAYLLRELEALPQLGVALVLVLVGQGNSLPVGVLNGGHIHRRGGRAQTQGDGHRHRREEVRGVVLLVEHLVADDGPACGLDHLDVQALALVKA